ncbi:tyrosine-type recombinase/integrase [Burkholderia ubonensis]|uniref:tyrosine-type recombinase/integrase n=1 Tax=Burkholderia ubonensis TaxID=101571 RepID=UPI0039F4BA9A
MPKCPLPMSPSGGEASREVLQADGRPGHVPRGHARIVKLLEREIFPSLGARPIKEISAPELLKVIRKIAACDAIELARNAIQACSQIFRYAIATGRAERDPAPDLRGALTTRTVVHMKRVSEVELPALMQKIDAYDGDYQTHLALQWRGRSSRRANCGTPSGARSTRKRRNGASRPRR